MTTHELMQRYLERLGVPPLGHAVSLAPSWRTLTDLVTRHLHTVPFENLDIVAGLRGTLTTAAALHKVAIRRRGGFCYELNEAFGALLRHLGFGVRRVEARVWAEPRQTFGPPFDHLALVVQLPEGEFLTDVGFGDNNRAPLRLPDAVLTDCSGEYTLAQTSDTLWRLSRSDRPLYEMTLDTQPLTAFVPMYHHHRTSAESLFAQGVICTRATRAGRITLSRDRLIVAEGAARTQTVIADRNAALEQYFGIVKESETC